MYILRLGQIVNVKFEASLKKASKGSHVFNNILSMLLSLGLAIESLQNWIIAL